MSNGKSEEPTYNECSEPRAHGEHLCMLMEKGCTAEVAERTKDPAFVCRNCGAQAHHGADLCNPVPL